MAASAKVLTIDNCTQNGDWKIVLPRRGKQRRNFPKIRTPQEQQQPWVPTDLEYDPARESKLIQKMQICIKKVESSQFFQNFLEQIQTPEILGCFHKVLGSELKVQMVVYGIGSIESYETPRFQLSLAILMKRKLNWIGDIELFDPILSATESRVLQALGCSVQTTNEQGRQCATKPTLFYMPHCEAELYNNLLQANLEVELLNCIVLFGDSFKVYRQHVTMVQQQVKLEYPPYPLSRIELEKFASQYFPMSLEHTMKVVENYKDFAFSDYARAGRALALYEVGDREEAIIEMEDVTVSLRGYPEVHAALAASLYVDKHAPLLAENQFTIAIMVDP